MVEPMVLYRYFQREASLPHPEGPYSDSVSPPSIRDASNDAVSKSRSDICEMGVVFV